TISCRLCRRSVRRHRPTARTLSMPGLSSFTNTNHDRGGVAMHIRLVRVILTLLLTLTFIPAFADEYSDTVKIFRNSGQSSHFFGKSYGYAVFPTIGKGGVVVGGAHGNGRVYAKGQYVGTTSMT